MLAGHGHRIVARTSLLRGDVLRDRGRAYPAARVKGATMPEHDGISHLEHGTSLPLTVDAVRTLPKLPGVYTIWQADTFLYVGRSTKLRDRLSSHARGHRGGDQFCVYISDRFVVPSLSGEVLAQLADGEFSIDTATRDFIRDHLRFRHAVLPTANAAAVLEDDLRTDGLPQAGKPLLNPKK